MGGLARKMNNCKECGEPLVGGRSDRKFCDKFCASNYNKRLWRERNPKSPLGALDNGTIAEANVMKVCIDLLERGYQVYRAAFPAMECDLIARTGQSEIARIEVTTGNLTPRGTLVHPKRDAAKFDVMAVVVGDDIYYKPELT